MTTKTHVDNGAKKESGRFVFRRVGGPEVLEWKSTPLPQPGPGEVRIRLEATCVNFTDILVRRGIFPDPAARKLPVTPGYDFVGRIDALGDGVTTWKVGDRVADLIVVGGYTEHLIRQANDLVRVPDSVDAAEAATLILAWVTAFQLIHRAGPAKPGMTILVHGAGGAVGRAMLVLLKKMDVKVYGTARSPHHDFLRSQGVTPIDYTQSDWEAQARTLVPAGFDLVYDSVGQDGYQKSWRSLRKGGKLVAFGFTEMVNTGRGNVVSMFLRLAIWGLLPNGRSTTFYRIGNKGQRKRAAYSEDLAKLFSLLERGEIQPQVSERLPLAKAVEAHRKIDAGELIGKLVLVGSAK